MKTIKYLLTLSLALSLNHVQGMKQTFNGNKEKKGNEKKIKNNLNKELLEAWNKENPNLEDIKQLINNKADINYMDKYVKHDSLCLALFSKAPFESIKYLVDNKANPSNITSIGCLSCACSKNASLEIIKLLVENNAHPNYKSRLCENALHWYVPNQDANPEVIKYLINNKTDVNCTTANYANTPLHAACFGKNTQLSTIKALLASFIDTQTKEKIFTYLCCINISTKQINQIFPKPVKLMILNSGAFQKTIETIKNYINQENKEQKTSLDIAEGLNLEFLIELLKLLEHGNITEIIKLLHS